MGAPPRRHPLPRSAVPSLNYRHLQYFWTVAREGSIARAAKVLHVTQPAISAQLQKLEQQLGEPLFVRAGRGLALTEAGRTAQKYADEIFGLGRELAETLRGRPTGKPMRLTVGVTDAFPKLLAYRLLAPALKMEPPTQLVVHDDRPERLFAELSIHEVDLVLTDSPLPPTAPVRAFNHLLGECGITFFGAPSLAEEYAPGFPRSLDGAPMLLPTEGTTLRRSLTQWFDDNGVRPRVVAEVGDSALLKTFGQAGIALFAGPSAIEPEIRRQYGVSVVGRVDEVLERFYAISVERRLKHPAVLAISHAARESLFTPRRRSRSRKQDESAATDPADSGALDGAAEQIVEA
jgi:LysR family transcriptional activator of nhaA